MRAPLLPLERAAAATVGLPGADAAVLRSHIGTLISKPEIHEALLVSSASLSGALEGPDSRVTPRTAYAVNRYLLRMTTRTTPFGLLAGAAVVRFGDTAKAVLGAGHTKTAVPDMNWLLTLVERWQRKPRVLQNLRVVANDLATVRDGRVELAFTSLAEPDDARAPAVVSLRHSAPVQAALAAAACPVPFPELADSLRRSFPRANGEAVDRLLRELVEHQILLTDLVPPPDDPDPLGHVLRILGSIPQEELPELAEPRTVHEELAAYRRLAPGEGRQVWKSVTGRMRRLQPGRHLVATDLRLDARVTLPREVAAEAERAADVLLRIAPPARTRQHLVDYHRDFLERYGTEESVPLRILLDPALGLGAPATYTNPLSERQAHPRPVPEGPNDRDRLLTSLAQLAALERSSEVVLTGELIERLDNGVRADGAPDCSEVFATLLARSCADLETGDFRLLVHDMHTSGSYAGAFGRFARLTGSADQLISFVRQTSPTSGAVPVQVSWRPAKGHLSNLARAPWWLPHRLSVGWFDDRSSPGALGVDDLVVTASIERFHIFSRSLDREVAPSPGHVLNYLYAPNAVRFLTEVTETRPQALPAWDWGSAAALPFLPWVRYGRTVLTASRWLPDPALREDPGRPFAQWADRFTSWRRQWRMPRHVFMAFTDKRIRIDLDESHHLDLLRQQLHRLPRTALVEASDADTYGWLSGPGGVHVNELIFPMVPRRGAKPRPEARVPACRPRSLEQSLGHTPGGEWLYAKLYSPHAVQNTILTKHLPWLVTAVADDVDRWFFLRYRDPAHHLRLRFHGEPAALACRVLPVLRDWADGLRRTGLVGALVLDTYHPELERYRHVLPSQEGSVVPDRPGLIEGAAGVALALLEYATADTSSVREPGAPSWTALLMLD